MNLWSDIGDEGSLEALRGALEDLDCQVLLPPSILVELLRPAASMDALNRDTVTVAKI